MLPSPGDIRVIVLRGEREKYQNNNDKKNSICPEFSCRIPSDEDKASEHQLWSQEHKWAHN